MVIYDIDGDFLQVHVKDLNKTKIVRLKDDQKYMYKDKEDTIYIFGDEFMKFLIESDYKDSMDDTEFRKRYILFNL